MNQPDFRLKSNYWYSYFAWKEFPFTQNSLRCPVVVLSKCHHILFFCQKSNLLIFLHIILIYNGFLSVLILRQIYSIYFSSVYFISIISIFLYYYRRFFYCGKKTTHYRYTDEQVSPWVLLTIWRTTKSDVSCEYKGKKTPTSKIYYLSIIRGMYYQIINERRWEWNIKSYLKG